jgi:DNA mismatch repair protein MutS
VNSGTVPGFDSILWDTAPPDGEPTHREDPGVLRDLNLDQLFARLQAGREEYSLEPFLHARLRDPGTVAYRQDVMRDLEDPVIYDAVAAFASRMRHMRHRLRGAETGHPWQRERWFLEGVESYCEAVWALGRALRSVAPASQGMARLAAHVTAHAGSRRFTELVDETGRQFEALATVRYSVHIKGGRVTVMPFGDELDYSAEVERAFAKFQQGTTRDYRVENFRTSGMGNVEARILDLVARLHPDVFSGLADYVERFADFTDESLVRFDREVQLYLAYLDHIAPMRRAGLAFNYPAVSNLSKQVHARDAFDIALAAASTGDPDAIVANDFRLDDPERVIVVTGPNQGGKTTFARMFGQLHYLAALGFPVPGTEARLFLCDRMFTHFEREEHLSHLHSKLEDELLRAHSIFTQATGDSIVLINEGFTSTTLHDALLIGTEMVERVVDSGMLCVYVTFIDELTTLSEATVSMVAGVDRDDPARRTFRIVRAPADGRAYADAIARKYGLDGASVTERLAR